MYLSETLRKQRACRGVVGVARRVISEETHNGELGQLKAAPRGLMLKLLGYDRPHSTGQLAAPSPVEKQTQHVQKAAVFAVCVRMCVKKHNLRSEWASGGNALNVSFHRSEIAQSMSACSTVIMGYKNTDRSSIG